MHLHNQTIHIDPGSGTWPRPVARFLLAAALLATPGCATLDADRELDITAATARRVTGTLDPADAWSLPVQGESPAWDGVAPLGYDAAVSVALQGDPTLRSALAVIVEKRAWYVQEGLPPNPTIAFGIGAAVDGLSGAPLFVQGLQALSWIWKNPWRVEAAEAELRAAVYTAGEQCVTIMAKTRTELAAVLAAQETLSLDERYVEITQKTVDLVREMQVAGELAQLDLDRAIVDHEEAVSSMIASQHALITAKLTLLGTMGRPDATIDWVAVGDLPPTWQIPKDENELLALAATGRLDVAASWEQVRKIEADLGLAETRRFPEVGLMVQYRDSFSGREGVLGGGEITIPILDNGEPAIAMQNAKLQQARMNYLAASEVAQREVRVSLNKLLEARSRVQVIRRGQLEAAIAAQERSDAAYAEGEVDLNTLLMTQRQRIEVERRLVQQEFATMQAMCQLRQAVGGSFDPVLNDVPEFEIEKQARDDGEEDLS
ncbi:MAG: TolC family protein [Phycisphaerales bacterium]|nr:TolC family protein [Phycisphaerales bacterium]